MRTMTPFERFAAHTTERVPAFTAFDLHDACNDQKCPICGSSEVETRRKIDHYGQTLRLRVKCHQCIETYAADVDARSALAEEMGE